MPKITVHGGPSYAGHTDCSPHDVAEPQWQPATDVQSAPVAEPVPVEQLAEQPAPRTRTRAGRS